MTDMHSFGDGSAPGAHAAAIAALSALVREAVRDGHVRSFDDRASGAIPRDGQLAALCAELGLIERSRARLLSGLPVAAGPLADLLIQRRAVIEAICETPARTVAGIRVKARAVRRILGDGVLSKSMRDAATRSLLTDMEGAVL
ncbi:hypothetical protein [Tanticharoenia sakaeratensis]|uniref:Uncharacterized protein n=1 Tax=Tanticharoenia sakaeratensis NBRC 103193 TaxID=1231623 RepID=A0A0D6MHQ3_9PROT|nr:hypothetical protein [Tanticharoenia sakaeratensis]GAN53162.1 hypothetical protein Tasa_007_007 [Tanticharoenia sakaeratensis NBRC 103193]GBQ23899.1 hypothetical protein AA103193_2566 [Tanticharoenia sakaeratensis NBRC 103193]